MQVAYFFLFQLVYSVLQLLFGFNSIFPSTKKIWSPNSDVSKELMCVCTNTGKSLRPANCQPGTAQCLSESSTFMEACVYLLFQALSSPSLEALALPGALPVCSCCLLHSEEPSISFWNKAASVQNQKPPHHSWWQENAVGIVVCTQAFISLRRTSVWNEWGRQEGWLQKQLSSSGLFLLKVLSGTVTRK